MRRLCDECHELCDDCTACRNTPMSALPCILLVMALTSMAVKVLDESAKVN
jgi:hypothetical protein